MEESNANDLYIYSSIMTTLLNYCSQKTWKVEKGAEGSQLDSVLL